MKRIIPVLLSGWMFACINVPEIEPARPPPSDAGPGRTEVPDAGPAPLGDLAVTITSPADVFYSSREVPITVEVRGGVAESVQLLKDGRALATLSTPPFQYTWDTTQEAEGRYALTARALRGAKRFESAPVAVVVDRTNLQVASRSPAHGATNVDYSEPFRVVFTKPVKASTVNDTTVSFAVAGINTEKTLALSSDGMTLTIMPKERPNLPATFGFGVSSGITDLAGNALATPITQSTSPWNFEVPAWYAFGGALEAVPGTDTKLKNSAMVLGTDGNPIVAWSEQNSPDGKFSIFVYRWDGKAFVRMGYPINGTQNGSALRASLALGGDGHPVIAWEESGSTGPITEEDIYVARWTGTSWNLVGRYLSAENDSSVPTPAHNPSLAVKGNDIYVAWDEVDKEKVSSIQVWKSINGSNFFGLGNTQGRVSAVPKLTNASNPSLVVDSLGRAIVAFQEQTLEQHYPVNIYVMRHTTDNRWAYAVPPLSGNDESGYVSGGLSATLGPDSWAKNCSLDLGRNDELYLAWSEESYLDGPIDVQVFKSNKEQTWDRLGSAQSAFEGKATSASHPKIKSTSNGELLVSWHEFTWLNEGSLRSHAREWNGTNWINLSTQTGIDPSENNSVTPALSIDLLGRPIVSWLDGQETGSGLAGYYVSVRRRNQ